MYITVSNDVVHDQRILRVAGTLGKTGAEIILLGRRLPGSRPVNTTGFTVKRFLLPFRRGFFFYASLNIVLFFYLLFARKGIMVANDLDTVLPCYMVSRLRHLPLVYDSHEYFQGVPEISDRPWVKYVWKRIEQLTVPNIAVKYTVNDSIARLYREEYHTEFKVVRNLSLRWLPGVRKTRADLDLPTGIPILVVQGTGINKDRGVEEAVMAMSYLDNAMLLIIGSGDRIAALKQLVSQLKLEGRVLFRGKMPYTELMQHTSCADVGLSLDKGIHLNYRYSLPNKLFDYIQAGIPVIVSDLPEVRNIVEGYRIGEVTNTHDPALLATVFRRVLGDTVLLSEWRKNLEKAAAELCWENEEKVLMKIYLDAGWLFNGPATP